MELHPFFHDGGPQPLAMSHAGDCSQGAKPGSFASYQLAWQKGFRCFQVDVVALQNGELISSHALTGRKRGWERRSVAELRQSGRVIATIDELLDAMPNSQWNFEIKSTYATEPLAEMLARRPEPPSRFLISSPFRPSILRDLHQRLGPDLALAASLIDGGLFGFGMRPTSLQSHAVQLWKPLVRSQRILDRCAARGIHVQVWTVNTAEQIHHYLDRGVPGIISDDHDLLATVMRERGYWPPSELDGAK